MHYINFKIALRNFWKNKGFSLINIGGLAVGLASCLLLLLYVNYEWSYDKQFKNIDRIYNGMVNLKINGKLLTTQASPSKLVPASLQELPGIASAARVYFNDSNTLFSYDQNKYKLGATFADPAFLQIFDYHFILGDAVTALKEPNSALITAATAHKLFGNENPLGKSLKWDDKKILKVTAVIEDLPSNQSIQFDVLQPWSFMEQENPQVKNFGWGTITCATFFKLRKNASFAATDNALRKLIKTKDAQSTLEAFLSPFSKNHLYNQFVNGKAVGGRIDQVKLFLFLAVCVLFIACINYMNLSTARSEKRAREVGVRKALGASRHILMSQFILESILLSLIAMCAAFAMLELSLPYFNHLLNIAIRIDYSSYSFWLTLLVLVLLTGILAGSYPAFYLSSFIPVKVLKGFTSPGRSSIPVRKVLVVLQFTLSVCMIICAIIIYTQIQFLKDRPLGFDQENLVQIDMEGEFAKTGKLEIFKTQLKQAGAITSATEFSSALTEGGSITGDVSWPGKAANDNSILNWRYTGYEFTATVGAKLLQGRDFSPEFSADTNQSVILNESAVALMQLKHPIGSIIKDDDKALTVVGVIKDYSGEQLGAKADATVYSLNPVQSHILMLRLNPAEPVGKSVNAIKALSQQINPSYPDALQFVNDRIQEKVDTEKVLSVLSNLFGAFAIIISCLGLLGLALYMAEQRNKEISIRKVLGAGMQDILILLNKDFIRLVIISNLIAFPLAYIIALNWLKKYDYKVDIAIWPFLSAGGISLIIALLTVSMQSLKVARANAVDALKDN
jgi:putative ABC transport system permease protein